MGTEPSAYLFGMDFSYPYGYHSEVKIRGQDSIVTINKIMHEIEKQDPDIILVGGQSGILPEHHYHLQGIKMEQYEFLQGCNPDAVILSINGNHDEAYIQNYINYITHAIHSRVLALVLFPFRRKQQENNVSRLDFQMHEEEIDVFKQKMKKHCRISCYSLASDLDMDALFSDILKFYAQ